MVLRIYFFSETKLQFIRLYYVVKLTIVVELYHHDIDFLSIKKTVQDPAHLRLIQRENESHKSKLICYHSKRYVCTRLEKVGSPISILKSTEKRFLFSFITLFFSITLDSVFNYYYFFWEWKDHWECEAPKKNDLISRIILCKIEFVF